MSEPQNPQTSIFSFLLIFASGTIITWILGIANKKNFFLLLIFISGCGLTASRPKLEMSMAQAAFMAAKNAKADVKAPALFRKAEYFYLRFWNIIDS